MEEFLFGVKALAISTKINLMAIAGHPLIWGFVLGFFVSTIIHGFIITGDPRHIPRILTSNASHVFEKITPRDEKGTYLASLSAFKVMYAKVRIVFFSAMLLFFSIVLVILIRF